MKKLLMVLIAIVVFLSLIGFFTITIPVTGDESMKGIIVDKGYDNGYFIEVEINDEGYIKFISPEENEQLDIGDEYEL